MLQVQMLNLWEAQTYPRPTQVVPVHDLEGIRGQGLAPDRRGDAEVLPNRLAGIQEETTVGRVKVADTDHDKMLQPEQRRYLV